MCATSLLNRARPKNQVTLRAYRWKAWRRHVTCSLKVRVVALPSIIGSHPHTDLEQALCLTSTLIAILTSVGFAPGAHPLLAFSRLHSSMLIENLPDLNVICQALPLPSDSPLESMPPTVSTSRPSLEDRQEERKALPNEEERRHAENAQQ